MNRFIAVMGVLIGSDVSLAQLPAGWLISVDYGPGQSVISPSNPSCTVRVSAWFSRADYAFAAGTLSVIASQGEWSDNRILPPLTLASNPGTVSGGTVSGIIGWQLHYPPTFSADTRNPIPLWEATWSTSNFTVRPVPIGTATQRFDVYPAGSWPRAESRLAGLVEGQGNIVIIPAPSAAVVAALLACGRRKRGWVPPITEAFA